MSSGGSITLEDIAAKLGMIEVARSRSERRGRLSVAKLIEQHGAGGRLTVSAKRLQTIVRTSARHQFTTAAACITRSCAPCS